MATERMRPMTAEEAYQKGQYDMRKRIEKAWHGWFTDTLAGQARMNRKGKRVKYYAGNVPARIRKDCKVRQLAPIERDR